MSNSDSGSADDKSQTGEFYFLLSDCLMEDRTLRDDLRQAKLVSKILLIKPIST